MLNQKELQEVVVLSEKNNGLEFELEMKKEILKSVQKFLFSDHIEEFEGRLAEHF
jgi:hypothetical protein